MTTSRNLLNGINLINFRIGFLRPRPAWVEVADDPKRKVFHKLCLISEVKLDKNHFYLPNSDKL